MSVVTLVSPVASIIRPLIGLGLLATVALIFRPLLSGLLRAALLLLKPRVVTAAALSDKARVKGILQINRMARDLDASQPGLAAELRHLASRG